MEPDVRPIVASPRVGESLLKLCWLGCGLALAALSARAEAPPPSREFWDYLIEFGDAGGEVFDPSDLAVAAHVRPKNLAEKNSAAGQPKAGRGVNADGEADPAAAPAPGEKSE